MELTLCNVVVTAESARKFSEKMMRSVNEVSTTVVVAEKPPMR
jgi:hypothetical protein